MNNVEVEEEEEVTPSSSPPTPPSPLPISVGPGNSKYYFSSSSPSPSPPFSAPTSADKLPHLHHLKELQDQEDQQDPKTQHSQSPTTVAPSSFSLSLDRPAVPSPRYNGSSSNASNCLQDLLEWFAIRCCSCCSWTLAPPPRLHQS